MQSKGVGCNGLCSEAIMVSHYHKVKDSASIYSKISATDSNSFIETLNKQTPIKKKNVMLHKVFLQDKRKLF